MKRIILNVVFILMALPMFGQYVQIEGYDLPNKSIEFLRKYYGNYNKYGMPRYFVECEESNSPVYEIEEFEVIFENGTKIEFDMNGELKSIDCGENDVISLDIIPSVIKKKLKRYFKKFEIIEYSIERGCLFIEYEIELKNGREFVFNRLGKIKN